MHDKILCQLFSNAKCDAIFSSSITGSGSTFPVSATVVGFKGKALITGEQGKFKNAVGEMVMMAILMLPMPMMQHTMQKDG